MDLTRFASLALACVTREYPNKIAHLLRDDDDVRPPRELTPAFYGCFDWHSAVHGHWTLARVARLRPDTDLALACREPLALHLTPERIGGEVAYVGDASRAGFERPYGLAWLLALVAELGRFEEDAEAMSWSTAVVPLERLAAARIARWLERLTHPIRSGTHSQTAFALGLIWDWAGVREAPEMRRLIERRALTFYLGDRVAPIAYEPSGHDFLSPALGEADLMRRVLAPAAFGEWLRGFLPQLHFDPVVPSDRSDGHLTHLDGLNLSRAWMLEAIAHALEPGDARRADLHVMAHEHREAGLDAVSGEHYAGGHWLASFALYLVTRAWA